MDQDVLSRGEEGEKPPEDIDWSSVEQVAGHVSRTTLGTMQQLWRSHCSAMDAKGKQFAEAVYSMHAKAIKEVASMKTFDLKPVLAALNAFTSGVRETVLSIFQAMRQADDDFAQAVYQTSRRAFARTLREALEAWDANNGAKLRYLKATHAEQLETQRRAAEASTQQRLIAHEVHITKKLKEEHKRKMTQAVTAVANLALAKDQEQQLLREQQQQQQQQHSTDTGHKEGPPAFPHRLSATNAGLASDSNSVSHYPLDSARLHKQDSGKEPGTPRSPRRTVSVNWAHTERGPGHPSQLQGSSGGPGGLGGGAEALGKEGGNAGGQDRPGTSAIGLEVLSLLADEDEDSPVNTVLACKELEVQLRHAKDAMQEQKWRVNELNHQLQMQQADVGKWKDKWIQEGAKVDGIKRECLQIVIKCEQRVTALQQEHLAEMSKRDMLLQRAKDTILRLEGELSALSGKHLDIRLVPHDTAIGAALTAQHSAEPTTQQQQHPHRAKSASPADARFNSSLLQEKLQRAAPPWKSMEGHPAPGALALQETDEGNMDFPIAPPAPGGTHSARPSTAGQGSGEHASVGGGVAPSENGSNQDYFG